MDEYKKAASVNLGLPVFVGKTVNNKEYSILESNGRILVQMNGKTYIYKLAEIRESKRSSPQSQVENEGMEPWELDAEEDIPDEDTIF